MRNGSATARPCGILQECGRPLGRRSTPAGKLRQSDYEKCSSANSARMAQKRLRQSAGAGTNSAMLATGETTEATEWLETSWEHSGVKNCRSLSRFVANDRHP